MWEGIAVILFAFFLFLGAGQINIEGWDGRSTSPRFFSHFLSVILTILGLGLIIKSLRKKEKRNNNPISHLLGLNAASILFLVASIFYLIILTYLGFLVTSLIYFFVLLIIMQVKGVKKKVGLSIAIVFTLYVAFEYGFKIPLPRSIF